MCVRVHVNTIFCLLLYLKRRNLHYYYCIRGVLLFETRPGSQFLFCAEELAQHYATNTYRR